MTLTAVDGAGNLGAPRTSAVDVYAALAALGADPGRRSSRRTRDTLAPRTRGVVLAQDRGHSSRSASWTRADASSGPGLTDRELAAGPATWAWNGKTDDGAFAPRGTYRIQVAATNGTQRAVQQTSRRRGGVPPLHVRADGRPRQVAHGSRPSPSSRSPRRPRVVVRQPGLDPWTITMTKKSVHDVDRGRHAEEGRDRRHDVARGQGNRQQGRRQLERPRARAPVGRRAPGGGGLAAGGLRRG